MAADDDVDSTDDWIDLDDADDPYGIEAERRRPRPRNGTLYSTVFSVRLERGEHRRLVELAEARGVGPTVFARALIRAGLHEPDRPRFELAAWEIEQGLAHLREAAAGASWVPPEWWPQRTTPLP